MMYRLEGHEPVPCKDVHEWSQWYETADRHVMVTRLIDGSKISTVFLGLDHSFINTYKPILFETALISGEEHYCEFLHRDIHNIEVVARYATWAEAEVGHMEWIEACVPKDLIAATAKEPT